MTSGFASSVLRTLLMQASWNYERMIGLGMASASEPLFRSLAGGRGSGRYRSAVGRATQFFNAHPYTAGLAVGALARAEHEGVPADQQDRLRQALVGALGSLGDRLFWAGLLPAASGLGIALTVVAGPAVGVAVFLVAYNVPHVITRWWAVRTGWAHGMGVARALTGREMQAALRIAGPVAGFSIGVALPIVAERLVQDLAAREVIGVGLVALTAMLVSRWIVPALGGARLALALAAAALVGGLV